MVRFLVVVVDPLLLERLVRLSSASGIFERGDDSDLTVDVHTLVHETVGTKSIFGLK